MGLEYKVPKSSVLKKATWGSAKSEMGKKNRNKPFKGLLQGAFLIKEMEAVCRIDFLNSSTRRFYLL